MDLTTPAKYVYEVVGCSYFDCLFYGGPLNLLGLRAGLQRPCAGHEPHAIGPNGCPRCHEIRRYRLTFVGPTAADQIPGHAWHVGEGWHPILARLHEQVVALVPGYRVGQIKEKFGELRVYLALDPNLDGNITAQVNSRVHGLLDAAEDESRRTCEYCGKPGMPTGTAWVKTLCADCRNRT
jgi:hypothetical protein